MFRLSDDVAASIHFTHFERLDINPLAAGKALCSLRGFALIVECPVCWRALCHDLCFSLSGGEILHEDDQPPRRALDPDGSMFQFLFFEHSDHRFSPLGNRGIHIQRW